MKSLLQQKEREVEQVSQVASKLTSERDNVADVVRQEFADRSVNQSHVSNVRSLLVIHWVGEIWVAVLKCFVSIFIAS